MSGAVKIWTLSEPGSEGVIAIGEDFICRGNPKPAEMDGAMHELASGSVPGKDFFSIKLHMLKQVNLEERKPYLDFRFGHASYEHFRIKDPALRQEIFDHLKASLSGFQYGVDRFSPYQAAKKPIIGAAVAMVMFLWSFYLAYMMEHGTEYEIGSNLSGVTLMLASLGTENLLSIFLVIFAIVGYVIIGRVKKPPVVHRLTRTK